MDFGNFTDKKGIFVAKRILREGIGVSNSTMRVLIFDTETTGLPKTRAKAIHGPNVWPHIVSISWLVLESDTNEILTQKSYIVKPNGWTIPADSVAIHGITNEIAEERGVPLSDAIGDFMATPRDIVVAHNLDFDENVFVNAMTWDLGIQCFYGFDSPKYCSMVLSADICRLPSKFGRGYKPPKLSELYEHVFRQKPIAAQLHGSMYDAKILADILIACPVLRAKIGLRVALTQNTNAGPKKTSNILYL